MAAPLHDEIEVTIMGNGFGECLVIHLGNSDWMIIDSFRGKNNRPVAIEYLEELGVDLSFVKYVVATHADTDHIDGLADSYASCPNATLVFSDALNFPGFLRLVKGSLGGHFGTIREKEEFDKLFEECAKRASRKTGPEPFWGANVAQALSLAPFNNGTTSIHRSVTCLSPSNEAKTHARESIMRTYESFTEKNPVGRLHKFKNNFTSIVLAIHIGDRKLLLGSDLEHVSSVFDGWNHILSLTGLSLGNAEFFKIPHHGSVTGHSHDVWKNLVAIGNVAAITSFSRHSSPIPKIDDLIRINNFSKQCYLIGSNSLVRAKFDSTSDTLLKKLRRNVLQSRGEFGRLSARSRILDRPNTWQFSSVGMVLTVDGLLKAA
jgi:hypothetical protein